MKKLGKKELEIVVGEVSRTIAVRDPSKPS